MKRRAGGGSHSSFQAEPCPGLFCIRDNFQLYKVKAMTMMGPLIFMACLLGVMYRSRMIFLTVRVDGEIKCPGDRGGKESLAPRSKISRSPAQGGGVAPDWAIGFENSGFRFPQCQPPGCKPYSDKASGRGLNTHLLHTQGARSKVMSRREPSWRPSVTRPAKELTKPVRVLSCLCKTICYKTQGWLTGKYTKGRAAESPSGWDAHCPVGLPAQS